MTTARELDALEADARYARDRAALYRARVWAGKRPTSDARLRQLRHASESADARLQRARAEAAGRDGA